MQKFYPDFIKNPGLSADRREWLKPGSKIFTMGSCFAVSVRRALAAQGHKVYPDYSGLTFERPAQWFDRIPFDRPMPPNYDTYTMRDEIEAGLGLWKDRSAGFLEVTDPKGVNPIHSVTKTSIVHQDPYRKCNYAVSRPLLESMADKVTAAIAEGVAESDIMIFTLGLTEVWRHNDTGRHFCQSPYVGMGSDPSKATFHQSTFVENYENVRRMLDMIFDRYPSKRVVISVSPVRLKRTFSDMDVATANVESKAILRAVAGQICREYKEQVIYFPSYEMALLKLGTLTESGDIFDKDGIVPRDDFVAFVTGLFTQVIGVEQKPAVS